MKTRMFISLAAAAVLPAQAATSIGVSIGIHAPGQYGRIDILSHPPGAVLYPQPIIYAPSPVARVRRPIYLYVPTAHQTDWGRHCGRYNACGQPVYFVQERWIQDEYQREQDRHAGHTDHKSHKGDKGHKGHPHGHGRPDHSQGQGRSD